MSAADRRTVGELLADSDAAGPRDAPRRNTRSRAGHGEELEPARRVSGRTVGGLAFGAGQPVGVGSDGAVAGGRGGDRPQRDRRTLARAGTDRRTTDARSPTTSPARGIWSNAHGRPSQQATAETQRDIQDLHGQVMHTLYVAAHGTAVALGAYVTDLQHRLEAGTRRRQPMAERPTALEITAAQGMIARFDGFEQLAGAYLFGLPPTSANPDQVREAAPATRLETALAAWEVQAHRTLANNPDPADLVRVARVQALITSTTGVLTEAAARKGHIDNDVMQRLAPALEANQVAWSRAAKRWGELTNPASRTDPALVGAASEVRAAIAAAATNPTGWATPDQLASRLDLPDAVKTLHLSMVASDRHRLRRPRHRGRPPRPDRSRAHHRHESPGGGGDRDRAGRDPLRRRHLDHAPPNRGQSIDPAARASQARTDQPRRRRHRHHQPGCRRGRPTRPQRCHASNQIRS